MTVNGGVASDTVEDSTSTREMRGRFEWADGRCYDGEWRCGKRHGRGLHINTRNEKQFGVWADDLFQHWEGEVLDPSSSN